MIARKGGSRHHKKPEVDNMLLFQKLNDNKDLVKDLGVYESISRNGGVDPKGISHNVCLLKALIEIQRSGEIHTAPLKKGLLHVLTNTPELNQSKYNGTVWVNLRAERITTILYHLRKFARDPDNLKIASGKLTYPELIKVKELLNMLELSVTEPTGESLQNESESRPSAASATDVECLPIAHPPCKRLKKEVSNVSVDSQGYPKMLASPCKKDAGPELQIPTSMRRRRGKQSSSSNEKAWEQEPDAELRDALGFGSKEEAMKKPASLAKVEATLKKDERPWWKLQKTKARVPERTYITGNKHKTEKMRLIVEITQKWSAHHSEIADEILKELRERNISKEDAVVLRAKLCKEYNEK